MDAFTRLSDVAQVAVTVAGFAAIIVVFKQRSDGKWLAAHADRFQGMLVHAFAAVFFCFVPDILYAFTQNLGRIWSISSLLLAAQILAHITLIARLPSSNRYTRLSLGLPLLVAGLLVFNVFGGDGPAGYPIYMVGILWHLFQASFLFLLLAMIPGGQRT